MKRINTRKFGVPTFNLNISISVSICTGDNAASPRNSPITLDRENSSPTKFDAAILTPINPRSTPVFIINEMDKIIDGLWLGGIIPEQTIIDNKFTHVLSIIETMPNHLNSTHFRTKWVNIPDNGNVPIDKYFDECSEFIKQGLGEGGKVYVHCQKGFSRSPTIIIAYLMKHEKGFRTFGETHEYVVSKRPVVCPNLGFMIALRNYAEICFMEFARMRSHSSPMH